MTFYNLIFVMSFNRINLARRTEQISVICCSLPIVGSG